MTRVYTSQELSAGRHIVLEHAPSQHIARVLRMRDGERLTVFNGDGNDYPCRILSVGKSVELAVESVEPNRCESPIRVTLAQAICRGDRMDFALQKSVELGVTSIIPLITRKGKVKLDEKRQAKKQAHWQAVVVSASEQCGRSVVPVVAHPISLPDWLASGIDHNELLALDPLATIGVASTTARKSWTLIVGPESGFDDEEIERFNRYGIARARLGPRTLRTETAAVCALSLLQSAHGDLK